MTALGRAVAWSYLGEALLRVSQPLAYLALSFLLVPEEFGLAVPCLMIVALVQVVTEFAFGKVVIQDQQGKELQTTANVACVAIGLAAALLTSGLGYGFGGLLFQDERVSLVLLATGMPVFLLGLSTVAQSVLQREMRFRALFHVRLASTMVFISIGIGLAYAGYGFWSIVLAQTASLLAQSALLAVSVQQPMWAPLSSADLRRVLAFAKWAWLTGLTHWAYVWVDSLIVGINLSAHDLGIYRLGNQVAISVFGLLLTPFLPVFFSKLSEHGRDRSAQRELLYRTIRLSAPIAVGAATLLYTVADRIFGLVLNETWNGIGTVTSVLALNHGLFWWLSATAVALRVMHAPRSETLLTVGTLLLSAPVFFWASLYGTESLVWSRIVVNLALAIPIATWLMRRVDTAFLGHVARYMLPIIAANLVVLFLFTWIGTMVKNDIAFIGLAILAYVTLCAVSLGRDFGAMTKAILKA